MPMQFLNNGTNGVIKGLGWGTALCNTLIFALIAYVCWPVLGEKIGV